MPIRNFHRILSGLDDYQPEEYFSFVTLLCIILWEGVFQWSRHVLMPSVLKRSLDKSHKVTLLKQGPSYLCSIAHSILTGGCAVHFFFKLSPIEDVSIKYTTLPDGMIEVDSLFLGYLIYDLIHVVLEYPQLGGLDLVLHHIVFMICAIYNGLYSMHTFTFSWLLMGEWSTVFLSLRWLCIKTGRGATSDFQIIQLTFAGLFFLTRIVIYDWGLWQMMTNWNKMIDGILTISQPPRAILYTTTLLVFAGGALNWVWMYKIFQLAAKPRSSTKETKRA